MFKTNQMKNFTIICFLFIFSVSNAQDGITTFFTQYYAKSKLSIIELYTTNKVDFKSENKSNSISTDKGEMYIYFNDENFCNGIVIFFSKKTFTVQKVREMLSKRFEYSNIELGKYWNNEEIATIHNTNSDSDEFDTIAVTFLPNI